MYQLVDCGTSESLHSGRIEGNSYAAGWYICFFYNSLEFFFKGKYNYCAGLDNLMY